MSDNYPDIAKMMAEANNMDIGWDGLWPETPASATEKYIKREFGIRVFKKVQA